MYEPMHTKKEDRNTRRQFNRNAQQQDSYNGITDNQPDEDTSSDQLYSDEYVDNEDKYSQFPKEQLKVNMHLNKLKMNQQSCQDKLSTIKI